MAATSLYDRLGGAQGVAHIVDDTIVAHLNNPVVKARFENVKDMEHLKKRSASFSARVQEDMRPTLAKI